jgi:prepilin-type processing-associated H-X9-DG protein
VHGNIGTGAPGADAVDPNLIKVGALFPYSKDVKVYKCPADNVMAYAGRPVTRSMSMNCWVGPLKPPAVATSQSWTAYDATGRDYLKQAQINQHTGGATKLFVFVDENPYTINDGFFVCAPGNALWVDVPASYHGRACGFGFADGHSEIKKWRDQNIINAKGINITPAISDDLMWLKERSTR